VQFSSLKSLSYRNEFNEKEAEVAKLQILLNEAKVTELEIDTSNSLSNLPFDNSLFGPGLKTLKIRNINTAGMIQLATLCSKLSSLTVTEVDFEDQVCLPC
jgi:hypothetical protein